MAGFPPSAHWRDSARRTRFFMIDARAAFPLVIFLLHIRLWSFVVAIVATIFFAALERYGFTVKVFIRWIRNFFAGPRKISYPWWQR